MRIGVLQFGTLSVLLGGWFLPATSQEVPHTNPRLIATDPDGSNRLTWSSDGKSVDVDPLDERQILTWGNTALAVDGEEGQPAARVKQSFRSPARELVSSDDGSHLVAVNHLTDKSVALEATPPARYGYQDFDMFQGNWRYQDVSYSKDGSQISIVTSNVLGVWSTTTGKRLRQVKLGPTLQDGTTYPAYFFRDGREVVVSMPSTQSPDKKGVFETATGKLLITFSNQRDFDFWNAAQEGRRFVTFLDADPKTSAPVISVWNVSMRREIWSRTIGQFANWLTIDKGQTLVLPTDSGIEFRSVADGKLLRMLQHPAEIPFSLAMSPDSKQLWVSYNNGEIWGWRL